MILLKNDALAYNTNNLVPVIQLAIPDGHQMQPMAQNNYR